MKNTKCECHGFEIKDNLLAHKKTQYGVRVCPNQAIKSSLEQMGNGLQLNEKQREDFKKMVLNK